jgi:hypothetical protein
MIRSASHTARARVLLAAVACLGLAVAAPAAWAAHRRSGSAGTFHARLGGALGLVPPANRQGQLKAGDVATGALIPETYHGGPVMAGGVTIHTIFWAPSGYAFQGSPAVGVPTYTGMVKQFLTDLAADSGTPSPCNSPTSECNAFTTLTQFGQGTQPGQITPGDYLIRYSAATDSIVDTNPYPTGHCVSPQAAYACILDSDVQAEVDRVISTRGGSRGLHDLWEVYLPPNVDECIFPGVCGTNAFGGYHSLSNVGNGLTIYSLIIDPIIETRRADSPGNDPEGFPDAELTVDIAAHETEEAITDPEGVGWMDPNGFEIGDKCEFGPQFGTPLGFAGDGSPYNQVINGDEYLIQTMWSNDDGGCVQGTSQTSNPLPLPQVNLGQYSSTVSGNTENNTSGIGVQVNLIRAGADGSPVTVAQASTTTAGDGSWSVSLAPHAVGDDRDEIDVVYSGAGAPSPNTQVILTGNGGNPYAEAGWTGWTALDSGVALTNSDPLFSGPSLSIGPCFQTGVLSYTVDGAPGAESPTDFCGTSSDVAETPLSSPVGGSDVVTAASNDNRAFQPGDTDNPNPNGGLVNLRITLGEPDSASPFAPIMLVPTGVPTCSANLALGSVACSGLVPNESYTLTDGGKSASGSADSSGTLTKALAVAGGDSVVLSSGSRLLTTLHVARLRVDIVGDSATVASGTCAPGEYWGGPLTAPPTNGSAGDPTPVAGGSALTGAVCPPSASSAGLPTSSLAQTDELSGGETLTQIADVADTSPMQAETMYGGFTALAEATDGGSPISLSINPAAGGAAVFTASNADTSNGVPVPSLAPGTYKATWVVGDANGDTRTVTTRFIEQSALQGPPGPQGPKGATGPRGPRGPAGPKPRVSCKLVGKHHNKIRCKVTFPRRSAKNGRTVRISVSRGSHLVALGHGRVRDGAVTFGLRELRRVGSGRWSITLVMPGSHGTARTLTLRLSMR